MGLPAVKIFARFVLTKQLATTHSAHVRLVILDQALRAKLRLVQSFQLNVFRLFQSELECVLTLFGIQLYLSPERQ